jgi:hypothetical protein
VTPAATEVRFDCAARTLLDAVLPGRHFEHFDAKFMAECDRANVEPVKCIRD